MMVVVVLLNLITAAEVAPKSNGKNCLTCISANQRTVKVAGGLRPEPFTPWQEHFDIAE